MTADHPSPAPGDVREVTAKERLVRFLTDRAWDHQERSLTAWVRTDVPLIAMHFAEEARAEAAAAERARLREAVLSAIDSYPEGAIAPVHGLVSKSNLRLWVERALLDPEPPPSP